MSRNIPAPSFAQNLRHDRAFVKCQKFRASGNDRQNKRAENFFFYHVDDLGEGQAEGHGEGEVVPPHGPHGLLVLGEQEAVQLHLVTQACKTGAGGSVPVNGPAYVQLGK